MNRLKTLSFPFFTMVLLFAGCNDSIGLENLQQATRLVIYAFPTTSDTILIYVSATRSQLGDIQELKDVQVKCSTNGRADTVMQVSIDSVEAYPLISFHAIGQHQAEDRILITAKAAGIPTVSAETTIPNCPTIEACSLDTIIYRGDTYSQIRLQFMGPKETRYFAARVQAKSVTDDGTVHWSFEEIETRLEPMLNYYTDSNIEFGTWNEFYHHMYVFETPQATPTLTNLRLCVQQRFMMNTEYQMQLFTLSEEFFRFLKSLNDTKNNDVGRYALALILPNYSNVIGGYGCVAGYNYIFTEHALK